MHARRIVWAGIAAAMAAGPAPAGPGDLPNEGFWAEVVTVTPTWLVVQNQAGQQFPIAAEAAGRHLIRTPMAPGQVAVGAVCEAVGGTLPNNSLQTGHVDIYDATLAGSARLGTSTITPEGREEDQDSSVIAYSLFLLPGTIANFAAPAYRHVVGTVTGLDPLTLVIPGNRLASIVPGPQGILVTKVSAEDGGFGRVRRGDVAYVLPTPGSPATPRTLNVASLVIYQGMR